MTFVVLKVKKKNHKRQNTKDNVDQDNPHI